MESDDMITDIFNDACKSGNLQQAQSAVRRLPSLLPVDIIQLKTLTSKGHLQLAQWLLSQAALNLNNLSSIGFNTAIKHGRIQTAKWIHSLGSVNSDNYHEAFKNACMFGKLRTAKWLLSLGCIDLEYRDSRVFRITCFADEIRVAHWLSRLNPNYLLKIRNGKIVSWEVRKWYHGEYTSDKAFQELNIQSAPANGVYPADRQPFNQDCPVCQDPSEIMQPCRHTSCVRCLVTAFVEHGEEMRCFCCRREFAFQQCVRLD